MDFIDIPRKPKEEKNPVDYEPNLDD